MKNSDQRNLVARSGLLDTTRALFLGRDLDPRIMTYGPFPLEMALEVEELADGKPGSFLACFSRIEEWKKRLSAKDGAPR